MRARVALFRAREDASASAARLCRLGFSVVCLPVIEIKARAVRPRQARYDAIVATSDKAFLCEALCVRPSPLYVVGARTGREAEAHGWRLASPPAPAAAELIDTLRRSLRPGASVLYLAGRDRKGAVETALGEEFALEVVETYAAEARSSWRPAEARALATCVAALHYSRRSAALAAELAKVAGEEERFLALRHVCLSSDVAEPLEASPQPLSQLPKRPTSRRSFARYPGTSASFLRLARPVYRASHDSGRKAMTGEEAHDVASGTAGGAPVNRDMRRDPGVIEGEVASHGAAEDAPPSARAQPRMRHQARPPQRRLSSRRLRRPAQPVRPGARGFAAGALAGLIVSALAAGAGYYYLTEQAGVADQAAGRLAGLESQAQRVSDSLEAEAKRENAAVASLDKRVAALKGAAAASAAAGLDKRLDALDAANAENAPKIAAATELAERLTTQVANLSAGVDAARAEISSLSTRISKLEAGTAPASVGPDVAALGARIDKVEAALATQKSETRVAPEKPSAEDDPAAIAIIAAAIRDRLTSGAPFGPELAALQRLGVEPARLAALEAVVNGAPTDGALAASFEAATAQSVGRDVEWRAGRRR